MLVTFEPLQVSRMGVPQENKSMQACQIMTCAADYSVLFWDTRPPKGPGQLNLASKNEKSDKSLMGVPTTFKHLDLSWKPMLKVQTDSSGKIWGYYREFNTSTCTCIFKFQNLL